jgi:hypothetical protein
VIGGVIPVKGDYGALAVDSSTGEGSASGDVAADETLPSFGRTMLTAVGVDAATTKSAILSGTVINAALA